MFFEIFTVSADIFASLLSNFWHRSQRYLSYRITTHSAFQKHVRYFILHEKQDVGVGVWVDNEFVCVRNIKDI